MTLGETEFNWRESLNHLVSQAMHSRSYVQKHAVMLADYIDRLEQRAELTEKRLEGIRRATTKAEARKKQVAFRVLARTLAGPLTVQLFAPASDGEWFEEIVHRTASQDLTLCLRPAEGVWVHAVGASVCDVALELWEGDAPVSCEKGEGDKRMTLRTVGFERGDTWSSAMFTVRTYEETSPKVLIQIERDHLAEGMIMFTAPPGDVGQAWMMGLRVAASSVPARVILRPSPSVAGMFETVHYTRADGPITGYSSDMLAPDDVVLDVASMLTQSEHACVFKLLGERAVGWSEFE